ncbi:MAG: CRISPR-associated endonuclease Cas1 [Chloroflexota bacterium]
MAVLYLVEQGSLLRKHNDRLVVEKEGETIASVPACKVEQVVIFGNVHLTTPAIVYLLTRGIDAAFLSLDGKYYGRLLSSESGFGELRQRHLRMADDPSRPLEIARSMVRAKLHNGRTLLQRAQRERPHPDLAKAIADLQLALDRTDRVTQLSSLIGAEGYGTAIYFRGFKFMLRQDLGFGGRQRRPPPDPINVLLSFGYTLLAYGIQAAVHTVGLDPYVGFLHAPAYSRPSLVLDIMEEFRPVVVDALVLRLVNARIITEQDFVAQPEVAERPMLLTDDARRRFLTAYEERLQSEVTDPCTGEKVTTRRLFERQARQIARLALGQQSSYQPWLIR